MNLSRERMVTYRELLSRGFTGIRHNLPSIPGNPAASRAHHVRARIIADRMYWLAAASAQEFGEFNEGAYWKIPTAMDPTDVYVGAFIDRASFESKVARREAGSDLEGTRLAQNVGQPTMSPCRMAAYRKVIQEAFGAIRTLLESDEAASSDSFRRRVAVGIADRMHNLAAFSTANFAGFNEEWFWNGDRGDVRYINPFMPDFDRCAFERSLDETARRD